METAEPLDENTMLEALKIADHLERIAAKLKGLGSRLSTIESPSLGEWCQTSPYPILAGQQPAGSSWNVVGKAAPDPEGVGAGQTLN